MYSMLLGFVQFSPSIEESNLFNFKLSSSRPGHLPGLVFKSSHILS